MFINEVRELILMFNFEFIFEFDIFNNIKFNDTTFARESLEFMNLKTLMSTVSVSKEEIILLKIQSSKSLNRFIKNFINHLVNILESLLQSLIESLL